MTCGASMARSSGPVGRRRGEKKGRAARAGWVGATGLKWRSLRPCPGAFARRFRDQGPFGLRQPRFILAIYVTAGQAHESKAFEPTMAHRLFHRRRGQGRWPNRLAETRVTVTRGSGAGAAGGESRRSSRRGRISRATSTSTGRRTGAEYHRTSGRLVQGVSRPRDAAREIGSQLCRSVVSCHDREVSEASLSE